MKLSIIIPAYNAEKTIRKTLDSVVSQTFTDYECIVIADSCTDSTAAIARTYGDKVRVIEANVHNDGLGRNIGLDNSTGEWVLFIDADDWFLHEYVFQLLAERIENNTCDAICFDMVWKHIGVVSAISGRNNELFPHCTNKCWRRSFIGSTRFPNIKPDSDAGFHREIMKKEPKFDIWNMPMYYYNFLCEGSCSAGLNRTAEAAKRYWHIDAGPRKTQGIRFSIIIPTHNAEGHIRRTLESIKSQTFKNYEIIVICDGCTDRTEDIAREYTDKVYNVNYRHTGYTRDVGMREAQGEYVLFTDDDDWWLHEFAFEKLDKKLTEQNPDMLYFSFIYKGYNYINPEGGQYLPAFWNKVWKRQFLQGINCPYSENTYMADVEFQDLALSKEPKIVEWNMPLYYYNYLRPGSMTHKRGW